MSSRTHLAARIGGTRLQAVHGLQAAGGGSSAPASQAQGGSVACWVHRTVRRQLEAAAGTPLARPGCQWRPRRPASQTAWPHPKHDGLGAGSTPARPRRPCWCFKAWPRSTADPCVLATQRPFDGLQAVGLKTKRENTMGAGSGGRRPGCAPGAPHARPQPAATKHTKHIGGRPQAAGGRRHAAARCKGRTRVPASAAAGAWRGGATVNAAFDWKIF